MQNICVTFNVSREHFLQEFKYFLHLKKHFFFGNTKIMYFVEYYIILEKIKPFFTSLLLKVLGKYESSMN